MRHGGFVDAMNLSVRFTIGTFLILASLDGCVTNVAPRTLPDASFASHEAAWNIFAQINRRAGNATNDAEWEAWITDEDLFKPSRGAPDWPKIRGPKQF